MSYGCISAEMNTAAQPPLPPRPSHIPMSAVIPPSAPSSSSSLPAAALSPPPPALSPLDLTLLTSLDSLRLHLSAFRVSVDGRLQDWEASGQQQQRDCLRLISTVRDELQERQHDMEREQTERWRRLRRSLRGLLQDTCLPQTAGMCPPQEQTAVADAAMSEERVRAMIAEGVEKAMQATLGAVSGRHDAVVDRLQQRIALLEEQLKQQQQQAAAASAAAAAAAAVSAPPASAASLHLSPSLPSRQPSQSLSPQHYPTRSLSPSSASALSPAAAATVSSSAAAASPARSALKKNVRFNEDLKARLFLDTDADEREEEEKQQQDEQKETDDEFAFPLDSASAVTATLPSYASYSALSLSQPQRGTAPFASAASDAQLLTTAPVAAAGLTYSYGQGDGLEQDGDVEAVKEEKMEDRRDEESEMLREKVRAEAEEEQEAVKEEQQNEEEGEGQEPLLLTDLGMLDAGSEKAAAEEQKQRQPETEAESPEKREEEDEESSDDSSDDENAVALPPRSSSWSLPAPPAAASIKSSLAIRADRPVSRLTEDTEQLVSILHPVQPPRAVDSRQQKEKVQEQQREEQQEQDLDSDSEVLLELEPSPLSTGITVTELALAAAEESSSSSSGGSDSDDDDDVMLIRG